MMHSTAFCIMPLTASVSKPCGWSNDDRWCGASTFQAGSTACLASRPGAPLEGVKNQYSTRHRPGADGTPTIHMIAYGVPKNCALGKSDFTHEPHQYQH